MRIIFIHGISEQPTNYSEQLYARVLANCRATLHKAGHSEDSIDTQLRRLVHHEIFWAELTTDLTNRYHDLAYEHPHFFWNALTKPIDPLAIQIMQYIKDKGDKPTGAMNILKSVDADFARIFAPGDDRAIVVAHSLGSVIAFDYLMGFRQWHLSQDITVDSFITMGSPIPIFTSAMGHADSELTLPKQVKKWVNIRSPRDAIARPLKPFFQAIPIADHEVSTGFFPLAAHRGYWTNTQTADIIAHEVLTALALKH